MIQIKLTATQEIVLKAAADRPDGSIYPLPKNLKGGSALKVITALEKKGMIVDAAINPPSKTWQITNDGFRLVTGIEPPEPEAIIDSFEDDIVATEHALGIAPTPNESEQENAVTKQNVEDQKPVRKTRTATKQAKVIEMLKRPEGATITQIAEATAWRSHTIRGFFAGTIKKKLGLELTRSKVDISGSNQTRSTSTYHLVS